MRPTAGLDSVEKLSLPVLVIEPRFQDHPASNLVTMLTVLTIEELTMTGRGPLMHGAYLLPGRRNANRTALSWATVPETKGAHAFRLQGQECQQNDTDALPQ